MSAENELLDAAEAEIFDLLRGGGDDDRWNDWCHDTAQEAVRRVLRVVADRARQKAATADRCANQANNDYSANHWIGASAAYRMLAAECDPSTEDGGTWRDQSIRDETESGA